MTFSFEFKTAAGGKTAVAFHFNIHGKNSQSDARDVLVAQLEDILSQAQDMKVSKDVVADGQAPQSPADAEDAAGDDDADAEGDTTAIDLEALKPADLKAHAAELGIDAASIKAAKGKPALIELIKSHQLEAEDEEGDDDAEDEG